MADDKNIQMVDVSTLPPPPGAQDKIDVSTLPPPPETSVELPADAAPSLQAPIDLPEIQSGASAPTPGPQSSIQLVSPEEQEARLQPESSTIQAPLVQQEQEAPLVDAIPKPERPITLTDQIKLRVDDWYEGRGGMTPDQKINTFKDGVARLQEEMGVEALNEEVLAQKVDELRSNLGLLESKEGIVVNPTEVDQYREQIESQYKKHIKETADKEKDGFLKDLYDNLNIGSAEVLGAGTRIMALAEKGGNALARLVGAPESTKNQDRADYEAWIRDQWRDNNQRYDGDIVSNVAEGNMGVAMKQAVLSTAETLPLLALLVAGNAAGATNTTLGFMGADKAANEYLRSDTEGDLPELTKIVNALGQGLSEVIFEGVGTVHILNNVKRAVQQQGSDVVRDQMIRSFTPALERNIALLSKGTSSMAREGASEMATQLTDNFMNLASGRDVDVSEGVADAGVIGALIGFGLSTPAMINSKGGKNEYIKHITESIPEDLDFETRVDLAKLLIQADQLDYQMSSGPKGLKKANQEKLSKVQDQVMELVGEKKVEEAIEVGKEEAAQKKKDEKSEVKKPKEDASKKEISDDFVKKGTPEQERKTREFLISELIESLGFNKEDAGKYLDYLEETTGTKGNVDVGDPIIYFDVLREAANIISAVKGERTLTPELKSGKTIKETIDLLKKDKESVKDKNDKEMFDERISTLDSFGEDIQRIIDAKLKENVSKKELPKTEKPSEKERGKPEAEKPVETGKEKASEVEKEIERTEKEAEKSPILIKSGVNIFGIDLDNAAAIKLWKKYFTARGLLPKPIWDAHIKSKGRVREQLTIAQQTVNDFNETLKKVYGKTPTLEAKVSKEQMDKINTALANLGVEGNKVNVFEEIPEQLHEPLIRMRNHIDALTRELVRAGMVEGELEAKFQENLGFYMTRTYRAHNDAKWTWDNIPDPVKNRAISFVKAEFPKLSQERVEGLLQKMLLKDGPLGTLGKSKLGAKDLGIMMKRKDVPIEIRDFLGEYRDPAYNYSTSVSKMAELLERHKFLEQVKNEGTKGENRFLFAEPTGEHHVPIVGEGDARFSPLSWRSGFEGKEGEKVELRKAYHTTPEYAEAFQNFEKSSEMSKLTRAYVKYLNVPVKYGKTILSPVTHARNYYANYLFHVANGRMFEKPTGAMAKAHKVIFQDLARSKSADFRKYLNRLVELNVIGESTRAGEVHDIVKDAEYLQEFDKHGDSLFKKAGRKSLRAMEKLYQVEDDVHKIIAYEVERARYESVIKKQNPEATPEELTRLTEEKAAEIVRKTMPTYSLVSEVIKSIRRVPLVGTFVSFPAEVIRTSGNTIALAAREMWTVENGKLKKNKDTFNIGAKRAAGIMTASLVTGAAATMSRALAGVDKDDEKDMRRFVAPWSKNSDLMILKNKGGGVYTYVDVGFSDPYNYLKKPVTAMLKGDDMEDAAWEGIVQLVEPFLGEELLASRLLDIARNTKKDSKDQVYNPQDDMGDRNKAKLEYLWGGVQPGALYTGKRIAKSFKKEVNDYGRGLTPQNELMNLFLGVRANDLDVARSMSFKLRRGGTDLKNAFDIYNKTLFNKQMSDKERKQKLENAEKSAARVIDELNKDYRAAIRLGVPEEELNRMVKKLYVGPYPAHIRVEKAVMSGDFPGIDPDTGKLKSSGGGKLFGK